MAITHKRILLKISGEVLMGPQSFGIDLPTVERVAEEVIAAKEQVPRSPWSLAAAISSVAWPVPPRAWTGSAPTTWALWPPS